MSAYFDQLDRASFNGVEFAWHDLAIKSSLRRHVHEYRRTAGGALEKHGRSVYEIRFSCVFDEALSRLPKPYRGNYPEGLYSLRTMFENEETHSLIVPTLGTIQACIVDFEARATPERSRSGEFVELTFLEDQSSRFLVDSLFIDLDAGGLASASTAMLDTADRLGIPSNIFDSITDAVNAVLAIRDTADMYSQLAVAKVLALQGILAEANRTLEQLQDPTNHELTEALKALWAEVAALAENVTSRRSLIATKTLPTQMTIQQASSFIYGRSDKAFDLLQLNEFTDALAIPAGTSVRYFTEA